MSEERDARYKAQTAEQFEALGRFVQAFELMVDAARQALSMHLQSQNPSLVYLTRMIFHHPALTAKPLFELFRAVVYTLVNELLPGCDESTALNNKLLGQVAKEYTALFETRNMILHGTPLVGFAGAEQDDFSEMMIVKWGVGAQGWKVYDTPKSAAELLDICARCAKVENAIRLVGTASMMPDSRLMFLKRAQQDFLA
jgi:hypothetical protein